MMHMIQLRNGTASVFRTSDGIKRSTPGEKKRVDSKNPRDLYDP